MWRLTSDICHGLGEQSTWFVTPLYDVCRMVSSALLLVTSFASDMKSGKEALLPLLRVKETEVLQLLMSMPRFEAGL